MPNITQEEIGKLKEGRYIIINGAACVIKKMQRSSPGKHGHAKYRVDAEDILTGSKKVIMLTGHAKVDVPIIDKKNAQVLAVSGKNAQIMDMETYETFEIEIPSELKEKIVSGATVVYWNILGKRIIKDIR